MKRAVRMFFLAVAVAAPIACGIDLVASGDGPDSSPDGSSPTTNLPETGYDATDESTQFVIPPTPDPLSDAGLDVNNANCLATCPEGGVASCDAGWCVFDCTDEDSCGDRLNCPPGIPCAVNCGGKNSCASGIDCTAGSACRLSCTGESSCDKATIDCAGLGCQVDCIGSSACHDGVNCDASTCALNCLGDSTCHDGTSCGGDSCTLRCGDAGANYGTAPCNQDVVCNATKLCDIGCVADHTCRNTPIIANAARDIVQCTGDDTCTHGSVMTGVEAGVLCAGNGSCGDTTYCDAGTCYATCDKGTLDLCCQAGPGKCNLSASGGCKITDASAGNCPP